MNYVNGSIWKTALPFGRLAILQYLKDGNFCFLDITDGIPFCIITDPIETGKYLYKEEELKERLTNWEPVTNFKLSLLELGY
jgi:hypothetical protein